MRARLKLNRKGVHQVLTSKGVRKDLAERAGRVRVSAWGHAPRVTGAYAEGLHVEQTTTDRAVARVVSDVSYAWAVEADHGTLTRALDAAR